MSRQPLIFKLVAEPSDPHEVARESGPGEGPHTPAVSPTPAVPSSSSEPSPLDDAADRIRTTDAAVGPEASPTAAAVPAAPAPKAAADIVTSELPPSLRARASGLDAFATERDIRFKTHPPAAARGPSTLVISIAASAVLGLAGLVYATWWRTAAAPSGTIAAAADTGEAQFDSQPTGATVVIDGAARGTTPLKLTLPVGAHTLEFRNAGGSRTLPLSIRAGVLVSQYVELQASAPAVASGNTGRLDVSSDPPGAQVRVDGEVRGVTPLTIERIEPREHRVTVSRDGATIYRTVRVAPGATASVVATLAVPVATTGAVGGFLSLAVPFEVQVFEGNRLIGSSRTDRLMLPTGRHDFELVNTALQFRMPLTVTIEAGRVAAPVVAIPTGTVSINALPWAEVFVDGRNVGTTPLANLSVPIGTHDVVWRHPQMGERRQTVTVTTQAPVRAGVNFSQ